MLYNFYFSTFMAQIFKNHLVAMGPLSSFLLEVVLPGPFLIIVPVLFVFFATSNINRVSIMKKKHISRGETNVLCELT